MKIYSNLNDELVELTEVSLLVNNIDSLIEFREFIDFCIEGMQSNANFNHEHLSDFLANKKLNPTEFPEVIICKAAGVKA